MTHHIKSASLPYKELLEDFAEGFASTVEVYCDEYVVQIPEAYGKGYIKGMNFADGLGLIEYSCFLQQPVSLHFTLDVVHPLKFIFCSEGTLHHAFEKEPEAWHRIDTLQNVIVASVDQNGHILHLPAGKHLHINSLEIDRERFYKKVHCDLYTLPPQLRRLFKDFHAQHQFFYQGNYSLVMSECIRQINNHPFTGLPRKSFLEAKALEGFSIQVQQFIDDQRKKEEQQIFRRADLELIKAAVVILQNNLSNPPTVQALANMVGTSPIKLQKGFQHLYDKNIQSFLKDLRMEVARDLLLRGHMNIGAIVRAVGLSNHGYFSRLFKGKYGITPKEFLRKVKQSYAREG